MNDGGPAFPRPSQPDHCEQDGMSLRDWFAGQALICVAMDYKDEPNAAAKAYRLADAMLAAREQSP